MEQHYILVILLVMRSTNYIGISNFFPRQTHYQVENLSITCADWQTDLLSLPVLQVKRSLSQFTPAQWDKDQWHPFMGPLRFIQVLFLCVVFMTVELNTFFLKFCLWIPPRNPLVVYRLILWWLIAIPTIREYNSYLQDRFD